MKHYKLIELSLGLSSSALEENGSTLEETAQETDGNCALWEWCKRADKFISLDKDADSTVTADGTGAKGISVIAN